MLCVAVAPTLPLANLAGLTIAGDDREQPRVAAINLNFPSVVPASLQQPLIIVHYNKIYICYTLMILLSDYSSTYYLLTIFATNL